MIGKWDNIALGLMIIIPPDDLGFTVFEQFGNAGVVASGQRHNYHVYRFKVKVKFGGGAAH